jgi:RNA polymerase sigma factor (TIGR02999 family)
VTLSDLFASAGKGDARASDALFSALYSELHRLAERQLWRSGPGSGLGATSLLHEAYMDMSRREGAAFPDKSRFLGYAARVMRGLIIDATRRNQSAKRGGQFEITGLDGQQVAAEGQGRPLSRLSDALDELALAEPALAELVDLKYFCGFTFEEIAALRGVAERTVQRHWEKARIYLQDTLRDEAPA